jgi:hypothetical protein
MGLYTLQGVFMHEYDVVQDGDRRFFVLPATEWALVKSDFCEARDYLTTLQQLCLPASQVMILRKALTLAAIVAYSRPFKVSRNREEKRKVWMPDQLVKELPSHLAALHHKLINDRDQAWAHSDWNTHKPQAWRIGRDYEIKTEDARPTLDDASIASFLKLISEIEERLSVACWSFTEKRS